MSYPRHLGTYWPDDDYSIARSVGGFTVENPAVLLHEPGRAVALKATDLQIVLELSIGTEDRLLDRDGQMTTELGNINAGLVEAGLRERLLAIMPGEEWQGAWTRGDLRDWRLVQQAGDGPTRQVDAIIGALGGLARTIRAVFPNTPVGHVEPFWNHDASVPALYWPPPDEYDFLGIDAYVDHEITRRRWDAIVPPRLSMASRYGKPLLVVPQTFREDVPGALWTQMPTIEQLGWWADLVDEFPLLRRSGVPGDRTAFCGLATFCLQHPHRTGAPAGGRSYGLTDYPDRLGAVQAYAAAWRARR